MCFNHLITISQTYIISNNVKPSSQVQKENQLNYGLFQDNGEMPNLLQMNKSKQI